MKPLEYFFIPVSSADAYKDALGFHTNYFVNNYGFLWALLVGVGIALVISLIFYFVFATNTTRSQKVNWWIASLIVGLMTYGATDLFLIGNQGSTSATSFYGVNELYVKENRQKPNASQYKSINRKIKEDLKKGKDVRVPFDFTAAVWSWIFFLGISACLKGYSKFGTQIPF